MYKILLTDDEQIVIDSLSFIINKNFEGQVQLYTALSGTAALEIATKEDMDIIFMDINMPGLSGLETVSCITKLKPESIIIILSAFDRFQYAQEAMNLGAYKYITKPVNRNVVIQTIRSAMDFIDTRRLEKNAGQELHKTLNIFSPMLENDFIYACIFNTGNNSELESYMDYFKLINNKYCFCCFEIPFITSENQHDTYLKVRNLVNSYHRCLISSFVMNRITIIFPILSENSTSEMVQQEIDKLYTILLFNLSSGIRGGVSSIGSSTTELSTKYNEALGALNRAPQNGGLLFADDKNLPKEVCQDLSKEYRNQILNHLRLGDTKAVNSLLDLFCTNLQQTETDINKIKNAYFELIVSAKNISYEICKNFESKSFESVFSKLSSENDLFVLKTFLQNIISDFVAEIALEKTQSENPIIKKACDYINRHLSEDISLEQLSDYVTVSSFYLSKLFHEEKGVTFVNYLADKRMEKAKSLLNSTDLPIKEISAMTGYNDQNYFSRQFKAKFGISPKEYRSFK